MELAQPELAELEHENWTASLIEAARCHPATSITRSGGVLTILTGLPSDWFNQILIERDDATPDAVLRAIAEVRGQGHDVLVRLRRDADDRFIPTLTEAGLAAKPPDTATPGMVAFPIDHATLEDQALPELDIRQVTDAAGVDDHRRMITLGFGADPLVADGIVCTDLLGRPDCAIYVGYVDGEPVAAGLGMRTGRTIGVYSIATLPTARRRGFGAAMTARVVLDGLRAGCDVASLQASAMGRPIYERLGFREVITYDAYAPLAG